MAIAVSLVERTPYRLRYLCVPNGQATASPDVAVITNRDDASTPDLRSDADTWRGQPIDDLVNLAATMQAAARQNYDGQGLTAVADIDKVRGHMTIVSSKSPADPDDESWSIDADTGVNVDPGAPPAGSTGFACLVIQGPNSATARAIASLDFQHTYDR